MKLVERRFIIIDVYQKGMLLKLSECFEQQKCVRNGIQKLSAKFL